MEVVDGDTLRVSEPSRGVITVRVIGIDTPETRDPSTGVQCGGPEATRAMTRIAKGRNVRLVADPTQDALDRYGRSLYYVDRTDGVDLGLAMIQRGWSKAYVYERPFARLRAYQTAEAKATSGGVGAWALCPSRFYRPVDVDRERKASAKAFVRRFYRRLSNDQYLSAWNMLGARRKAQVRPYRRWKAGYRGSIAVAVLGTTVRLSRGRAVVGVRLRARDRDACRRGGVRQYFRGSVTLAPSAGSWVIAKFKIRKTGGQAPRTSKAQCPDRKPPPSGGGGGGGSNCHPSYPDFCIPPAPPDLDCDDVGSSDFTVRGDDPHGFDSEGDGVGCES